MKNLLTLACFTLILFTSCGEKKNAESTTNTLDESSIQKMETQTEQLKSIEDDLSDDLNDMDVLMKELDEN